MSKIMFKFLRKIYRRHFPKPAGPNLRMILHPALRMKVAAMTDQEILAQCREFCAEQGLIPPPELQADMAVVRTEYEEALRLNAQEDAA